MAEEIKELIERIQREGIKIAEDKAAEIEGRAEKEAEEIIRRAKNEAANLIAQAEEKVRKMEEAAKISLSQAGRDLLISLREEVNAILDKIMLGAVRQALKPEELAKILHSLIIAATHQNKGNIIVSVSTEDLEKLEKGFLAELKEGLKLGIRLKAQEDIAGGFLISYDAGKSSFDFTDKALAEYLGERIKPELARLLKEGFLK